MYYLVTNLQKVKDNPKHGVDIKEELTYIFRHDRVLFTSGETQELGCMAQGG